MKEATEFFSGLGTHLDPAVIIPVAVAVAAFVAGYFLFRKKELPPEIVAETQQEQPEPVSTEPEEAEQPAEPPAPEVPPAEVAEPASEQQFAAPEPVVAEEKETVPPPPDPVSEVEPVEVPREPVPPKSPNRKNWKRA